MHRNGSIISAQKKLHFLIVAIQLMVNAMSFVLCLTPPTQMLSLFLSRPPTDSTITAWFFYMHPLQ